VASTVQEAVVNARSLAGLLLLTPLAVAACTKEVDGLKPVGGAEDSLVQQQRFVRRLYLDLTGAPPTDAETTAATDRLAGANDAATRGDLAQELIETDAFTRAWTAELENKVFAGELPESRFQLICAVYRNFDVECQACPDPTGGDLCSECSCYWIQAVAAERELFSQSAGDLANGTTTSTIERRYAGGYSFRYFGAGEVVTQVLWSLFLGRDAGLEEIRNGRMMVNPLNDSGNPVGVIFHRHGANYADLVDIVFDSEAYREAVVDMVFLRYLGRNATPMELAHFSATLDDDNPDSRGLIRAVTSSREYFEQ
jgi:hypothetical protein